MGGVGAEFDLKYLDIIDNVRRRVLHNGAHGCATVNKYYQGDKAKKEKGEASSTGGRDEKFAQ